MAVLFFWTALVCRCMERFIMRGWLRWRLRSPTICSLQIRPKGAEGVVSSERYIWNPVETLIWNPENQGWWFKSQTKGLRNRSVSVPAVQARELSHPSFAFHPVQALWDWRRCSSLSLLIQMLISLETPRNNVALGFP